MKTDGKIYQKVCLSKSNFDSFVNPTTNKVELVEKFSWKTYNRMEISLITYGASLIEIKVPDREGNVEDVLMGYEKFEDYLNDEKFNFGSIIGPISSKLRNGEFCIKGKNYRIRSFKNNRIFQNSISLDKSYNIKSEQDMKENQFSHVNWSSYVDGNEVILSHTTDQLSGFPGIVLVQALFSVMSNNTLIIKITARTNQVTPIDISNRFHFNLAGHDSGEEELMHHLVAVNADKVFSKNSRGIFERNPKKIEDTELYLKSFRLVEDILSSTSDENEKLIDNHLVIDKTNGDLNGINFVSRLIHPISGRVLEVQSNQPTVNFTNCAEFPAENLNFFPKINDEENSNDSNDSIDSLTIEELKARLSKKETSTFRCRNDTDSIKMKLKRRNESFSAEELDTGENQHKPIAGKNGAKYFRNSGFSISCQNFHNALYHQKDHPDILLKPGQVYENFLSMKFGIHVRKHQKSHSKSVNFPKKQEDDGNFPLRQTI